MKHYLLYALCLCAALTAQGQREFNTRIIPTPQQVAVTENAYCEGAPSSWVWSNNVSKKELQQAAKQHRTVVVNELIDHDSAAAHGESFYQLEITPTTIYLRAATANGEQYGRTTLLQLAKLWNNKIPCMVITDWAGYEWRGWLDDISRGPIPHEAFRNQQQQWLIETFKMNFGSYYTEHALYNPTLPDIVPPDFNGSWLRHQPWLKMANLQCFAHFEKTLRIPFYHNLRDTRYNLNPAEEEVYNFLQQQIANTLQAYPQEVPFFNINCDETEGLGSGRARHYVDSVGSAEAYCQHINRVYNLIQHCAAPHKPEVLMWGDIVGKEPEMLRRLPKEMNYIVWSYVAQESYTNMLAPFAAIRREQGNPFWVAPGVSHWSSIPQVDNYLQNIAYLARDGYMAGARGLINTAWDDSGESLFGNCWHAMAWAAEMAWKPLQKTDPIEAKLEYEERLQQFDENYDRYTHHGTTQAIHAVGSLAHNGAVGDWYNTAALMQPLLDFYPSNVSGEMLQRCDSVEQLVQHTLTMIDSAATPHFAYACHRLLLTAEKCRLRVLLYRHDPQADELAKHYFAALHRLKLEYLRLWDEECTTYSRSIVSDHYDHLGREVLDADGVVFISTFDSLGQSYVCLQTLAEGRPIFYTTNGSKPTQGSALYTKPFVISSSGIVKTLCHNAWQDPIYGERYLLHHKGMGHLSHLNSTYSTYRDTYSAGGEKALTDGALGSDTTYNDGHWQGYWGEDIDVELNFEQRTAVNSVSMRFLQNTFDWILAPTTIELYTSKDGKQWQLHRTEHFSPDFRQSGNIIHTDALRNLNLNTQHLRVVVKNPGTLPSWHPAPNQPSYLFCDEIVVE